MKNIKIPHGITSFGIIIATYSYFYNYKIFQKAKKINIYLQEELNRVITKSNNITNNLLDYNLNLSYFDNTKEIFNKYLDYFNSFDLLQQLHILNIIYSLFLLSLLLDYFIGLQGNYLIEKLKLITKFPKLAKLIQYRILYQKYYFKYLALLGVSTIILNIIFNVSILLT